MGTINKAQRFLQYTGSNDVKITILKENKRALMSNKIDQVHHLQKGSERFLIWKEVWIKSMKLIANELGRAYGGQKLPLLTG